MLFRTETSKVLPLPSSAVTGTSSTTTVELNLISGQHLAVPNAMSTLYVVAYIDPDKRLSSRTVTGGGANPAWNDKMIFSFDADELANRPDLCIVIQVYRTRRVLKDKRIGCLHLRLHDHIKDFRWSTALMLRGNSGEPRGFLNVGVIRLDAVFRHVRPGFLCSRSAVDYKTLTGRNRI